MLTKKFISSFLAAGLVLTVSGVMLGDTVTANDARVANAAMQGDRNLVQSLIQQKADVNAAQGDGTTALHWAAFKDDLPMVQMLLKAGANVKAVTRDGGITPLFMACGNGDAAMIEALLKAGADPNAAGPGGATPLMKAATSGSVDAVNALIAHGVDVNSKETYHGQTALMFAAAQDRGAVVKALVAHGADMKVTTKVVKLEAARYDDNGNPLPARGGAAQGGGTVTGGNTVMGGMTALLFAARDGKLEAVKALVEAGADVNQISAGEHSSPLVIAAENSHYEVAKYLVDHGADPNLANVDGLAALYATIDNQYAPLSWAPVPLSTQEKVTHIELMADLLEHGANPNAQLKRHLWFRPSSHDQEWIKPDGATAFWRAAQADDIDAMKLLVAHGADPKILSNTGDNALGMAAGLGWSGNFSQNAPSPTAWMDSVKYCIETLGFDVNATDKQGFTPIMGAAWRGNNDLIKYLVDKGAKLDVHNQRGWSVTDMANAPALRSSVPVTHPETIAYLIKLGAPELTPIVGEAQLGSNRGRGGRGGRGGAQAPAQQPAPQSPQAPR